MSALNASVARLYALGKSVIASRRISLSSPFSTAEHVESSFASVHARQRLFSPDGPRQVLAGSGRISCTIRRIRSGTFRRALAVPTLCPRPGRMHTGQGKIEPAQRTGRKKPSALTAGREFRLTSLADAFRALIPYSPKPTARHSRKQRMHLVSVRRALTEKLPFLLVRQCTQAGRSTLLLQSDDCG